MKCPGCGAIFCPDRGPEVNVYCSYECKRRVGRRVQRSSARRHLKDARRTGCESKHLRFATEADALGRLDFINGNEGGSVLQRAYLCEHCEGWHLTRRARWTPSHKDMTSALADLAAMFPARNAE